MKEQITKTLNETEKKIEGIEGKRKEIKNPENNLSLETQNKIKNLEGNLSKWKIQIDTAKNKLAGLPEGENEEGLLKEIEEITNLISQECALAEEMLIDAKYEEMYWDSEQTMGRYEDKNPEYESREYKDWLQNFWKRENERMGIREVTAEQYEIEKEEERKEKSKKLEEKASIFSEKNKIDIGLNVQEDHKRIPVEKVTPVVLERKNKIEKIKDDFGYEEAKKRGEEECEDMLAKKGGRYDAEYYIKRKDKLGGEWNFAFSVLSRFIDDFQNANPEKGDFQILYDKYMTKKPGPNNFRYSFDELHKSLHTLGIRNGFVNRFKKKEEDSGFNKKFAEDAIRLLNILNQKVWVDHD